MAGPCLTAPKSLLSSRTLPVGAPAFSSPPADQQQQQQEAHAALHAWQRQQQQRQPWKASLGPDWDAKLPHDQRYGEKGWRALETYDRWLRGQPVMACVFGSGTNNMI